MTETNGQAVTDRARNEDRKRQRRTDRKFGLGTAREGRKRDD